MFAAILPDEKFGRIRHFEGSGLFPHNTGLFQSDTAVTTEANLALALENYDADGAQVNVDFTTVWGMGNTMAERSGNAADNFIEWVNACCAQRN